MKKKILTFMLSLCFILPCAFLFSACGKEPDKEPVSVTIEFGFNPDHYQYFANDWEIDEATNTFKTTYLKGYVWGDYYFNVVATTENGDTRHLYEATESNPMGYRIDTNMPDTNGRLPVGTYTYRLYCEDFNNGQYKAEACESETYTIIIEKEPIRVEGYEWHYNTTPNTYYGDSIRVSLDWLATYSGDSYISLEDAGITNFRYVNDNTYTNDEINANDYIAKVEYDADTANFEYDHLPEKTFEWSIEKSDIGQHIDLSSWIPSSNEMEYFYGQPYTIEVAENNIPDHLPLRYLGMGGEYEASEPGTYTCWPLFEQTDTENYTLITDYADELKFTWTITKSKLYVNSDTVGLHTPSFEYDGDPKPISESSFWCDPYLIIDKVEGDTEKTDAGTYHVRVYLKPVQPDFYEIVSDNDYLDFEWKIEKKIVEFYFDWYLNGVENGTTVGYTGTSRTPIPATNLPLSYVKHYDMEGNELEAEDITEIGRYKTVAIPDYDLNNYILEGPDVLEFEWEIVKGDYEVSSYGVWNVYYVAGEYEEIANGTASIYECEARAGGEITLTFNEDSISPNEGLTYKFSTDDGDTFVEEAELVFDASTANTYKVIVVVENYNQDLYNPVNTTPLQIVISIT